MAPKNRPQVLIANHWQQKGNPKNILWIFVAIERDVWFLWNSGEKNKSFESAFTCWLTKTVYSALWKRTLVLLYDHAM